VRDLETVGDLVLPDDRHESAHRVIIALVKARVLQLAHAALSHAARSWRDGSLDLHRQVTFDEALNLAVTALPPAKPPFRPVRAEAKRLLDYITAKPLLDPAERAMLAGYVRRLLRRIDELEPRKPGRPKREPGKAQAVEQAERYAGQLVRLKQAQWRRRHHRERIPAAETEKMIQEAKRAAAREVKVPVWQISEANIRNALKSGRFTVR
jgi:hypothetical protein